MDRFGNYVIERELGRGGMGVVYAARHAILGHHVGLKILHAELSQREDVVQRFFNEARAAAAIDHPGIVRVHDVGIAEHIAFLVMDLLAGESLAQRLKTRGPMPVPIAVSVARQIAMALGAAHAAGIVHRDLKPDNIFLVDDPHAPHGMHVVLLDFGVAKLTGALQSGDLRTQTGALLGTPSYMSPEQCDGEREIDFRSDLYSLGCMLFQMVSGRLPFEGGLGSVLGAHLHVPAPSLHAIVPSAPAEIEVIVARLMAKDPAARFGSAAELVGAFDAWIPTEADLAAPVPRTHDVSIAPTLPAPRGSDPTIDSVNAQSDRGDKAALARPSIRPPDDGNAPTLQRPPPAPARASSSRRRVVLAGAAVGLAAIGALAFALTRGERAAIAPDATLAVVADAMVVVTDAAVIDAEVAGNRIDARRLDAVLRDAAVDASVRDAAVRDAAVTDATVLDAVTPSDASAVDAVIAQTVDAMPTTAKEAAIQKRLANLAKAEADWEASREYMILEVEGPGDPRLVRAKQDAKAAIKKFARNADHLAIHTALVDHDWATGLAKCETWGQYPRVDLIVQCTVFACIGKNDVRLEQWAGGVGSEKMRAYIAEFCSRYRKE